MAFPTAEEEEGVRKTGRPGRRACTVISIVLVLAGAALCACPTLINFLCRRDTDREAASFEKAVRVMQAHGNTSENNPLEKLLRAAEAYNAKIRAEGQKGLTDPFADEAQCIDLSGYGIQDDLFGFVEIPKLNIKLGIYLGATRANMAKGAVHLAQTSLPIGGTGTNAVLAAHRGTRREGDMFLHIDWLAAGDRVIITNAWGTLVYAVTSTAVIAPDAADKVLIRPGKDMVTLISCNPYGKSTQRYVVYCDRVPGGGTSFSDSGRGGS